MYSGYAVCEAPEIYHDVKLYHLMRFICFGIIENSIYSTNKVQKSASCDLKLNLFSLLTISIMINIAGYNKIQVFYLI